MTVRTITNAMLHSLLPVLFSPLLLPIPLPFHLQLVVVDQETLS